MFRLDCLGLYEEMNKLERRRKFSVWRSILKDGEDSKDNPLAASELHRGQSSSTSPQASPWVMGRVDASQFTVVKAPRRATFQNLRMFLRNSKVQSEVKMPAYIERDKTDLIIKFLFCATAIGVLLIILLLLIR